MPQAMEEQKSAIARTCAYTLTGLPVWPFLIAAYVRAGKAGSGDLFEVNNKLFQRRIAKWALVAMAVVSIVSIAVLLSVEDFMVRRTTMIQLSNLFYVIWGWAGARSIRALYLAGAGQSLDRPDTWWVWPAGMAPAKA